MALLIVWTFAHMALLSWADLSYVMPVTAIGYVVTAFAGKLLSRRNRFADALGRHRSHHRRRNPGRPNSPRASELDAVKWFLVVLCMCSTTVGDVFRSLGMRSHGEIHDFRRAPSAERIAAIVRNWMVIVSTCAMAVSFFSFMKLVSIAPMTFAVPMSAATFIPETLLARYLLHEASGLAALDRDRADRRRRRFHRTVIVLAVITVLLVVCGIAYNFLAIAGAMRFRRRARYPIFVRRCRF